jgi:hypothetical protein
MDATEDAFDTEDRELCADGACTGVIGPDGKCKACGRPAGAPPQPGEPAFSVQGEAAEPDFLAERGEHVFDEDDRQLCPDGNCTGLIGADGKCKVCGLPATANLST